MSLKLQGDGIDNRRKTSKTYYELEMVTNWVTIGTFHAVPNLELHRMHSHADPNLELHGLGEIKSIFKLMSFTL